MEKLRKSLLGVSIGALVASCIMLVLAVFRVPIFEGVPLRVLLCLATLSVACGLALSDLIIVKKNKLLGFVGLGLLVVSTLLALICFCSNLLLVAPTYNRITGIIAVLSVAYTSSLVVYSRLGKHILWLQIVAYFAIGVLTGFVVLMIAGEPILEKTGMLQSFIVTCIVAVGSFLSCYIIGVKLKDAPEEMSRMGIKLVKIEQTELDNLKKQIESLKDENEFLRKEIETLKSNKTE